MCMCTCREYFMTQGYTGRLQKTFMFKHRDEVILSLDYSELRSLSSRCMLRMDECIHAHQNMLVAECTRRTYVYI